jgi:hypothetical protein
LSRVFSGSIILAAEIFTTGFASVQWARLSTACPISKLRGFRATFFIFIDYARPAIRLSALMELPAIFIFWHDAMGVGEDGHTH